MLEKDSPSKRIIRWLIDLSDFDFIPKYRGGSANANADALSRLPIKDKERKEFKLAEKPNNDMI